VLDALPLAHKKDFIRKFVSLRLVPHEAMFGAQGTESGIEHVGRRIAWFKRTLKELEVTFKDIFPPHWHIWAVLADGFCSQARRHLDYQLSTLFKSLVASQQPSPTGAESKSGQVTASATDDTKQDKEKDKDTRRELVELLSPPFMPVPSESDLGKIVASMQEVLQFEREMRMKFLACAPPEQQSVATNAHHSPHSSMSDFGGDTRSMQASSAADVIAKYKSSPAGPESKDVSSSPNAFSQVASPNVHPPIVINFVHAISVAYLPYLCLLVSYDQKVLLDLVAKFSREEKWQGAHGNDLKKYELDVRYDSSNVLLLSIKRSMDRCIKLTTGHALRKLVDVYVEALKEYADLLSNKLMQYVFNTGIELEIDISPKTFASASSGPNPPTSPTATLSPAAQRERDDALRCFCLIIKTGDYICATMRDMFEHINSKIHPELVVSEEVVQGVETAFNEVVGKARTAVVSTILAQLTSIITSQMLTTSWGSLATTGDQSDYVTMAQTSLKKDMMTVYILLSAAPVYYASVCTAVATNFLRLMYEAVYKCGRFNNVGAAQLAVDVYALRSTILALPQIRMQPDTGAPHVDAREAVPGSFTRQVRREAQKLDALAKILGSSARTLVSTYSTLVSKPTVHDFQKMMDLIGLSREDAAECMREFREANPAAAAAADAELLERASTTPHANETVASTSTSGSGSQQGSKFNFGRLIDKLIK